MEIDTQKMAEKLVELRAGRSQAEVAEALGISVSALSMYEQGQRVPRDEIKVRIANYYNVSIPSIFFILKGHETCTAIA